jgi:endonuclease YncB( thermonuclease family)
MKKVILMMLIVASLFANELQEAKVKRVIDGDTLMLQKGVSKPFKVHLIALDTFETKVNHRVFKQLETLKMIHPNNPQHKDKYVYTVKKVLSLGYKASDYVKARYLGKKVKFYFYKKDKYGRDLVWIDVLNFSLVRQGLALYYPNSDISKERKKYMLELSRDANLNKRGIYKRF